MKTTFLRLGAEPLDAAVRHRSTAAAIRSYRQTLRALTRYGQGIEATLHVMRKALPPQEYPDFVLSPGKRCGTISIQRA